MASHPSLASVPTAMRNPTARLWIAICRCPVGARVFGVVAFGVLGAIAGTAWRSSAAAQAPVDHGPPPGLSVETASLAQGATVDLRGARCFPGAPIVVTVAGAEVAAATAGQDGGWTATFAPGPIPPGTLAVAASGCRPGAEAQSAVVHVGAPEVVREPPPPIEGDRAVPLRIVIAGAALGAIGLARSRARRPPRESTADGWVT